MFELSLFLVISCATLLLSSPTQDEHQDNLQLTTSETKDLQIYRLPEDVYPTSYTLRMMPDMEALTFKGDVQIDIEVKFSTKIIKLHSSGLSIKSVVVEQENELWPSTFRLDELNQLLIIETEKTLPFNTNYQLTIKFEGALRDDMSGFYKSSYMYSGKQKWLAATQFESIDARKAFPCFDEPKYKTPFTISIARRRFQKTISNMPIASTSFPDFRIDFRVWDKYRPTSPLPTYLVSFMVCDFTHLVDSENFVKVHARENARQHLSYALQQSQKLIKNMEDYVSISHGLPKLDVIGIPDFAAGAMENWGMTTYRERYVILDESKASEAQKSEVTRVISHEFSHQWFGDLVTLAWWDYLWLNEGFARYFEFHNALEVEPSWSLDERFVIDAVQAAMWNEIGIHRRMTTRVEKVSQTASIFDVISYPKGASIIRMFEHIMTKNCFKGALNRYLQVGSTKLKGTVTPANLFEAFEFQASITPPRLPPHVTITQVMKSWTENIGYPLITVKRNRKTKTVTFEQSTYKSIRANTPSPNQDWIVPISYTTKSESQFSDTRPSLWSIAGKPVPVADISDDDWVLCNLQQTGYYRVNYCSQGWKLLTQQLKEEHNKISVVNRAQLLDDSFVLATDLIISPQIPFELVAYLEKETEITPWLSASKQVERMFKKYGNAKFFHKIHMLLAGVMEKAYKNLGFNLQPTDKHLVKVGKPSILYVACLVGIKKCIEDSLNEYQKNALDITKVQPDLKKVVFCNALRHSENPKAVYEKLWTEYLQSNIPYEQNLILSILGCAKDEDVLKNIISKLLDNKNEEIRKQDIFYLKTSLLSFTEGVTTTIKYLLHNSATIKELNEDKMSTLKSIIHHMSNNVQTDIQTNLLNELITEWKALDQQKYGSLVESAEKARSNGLKNIKSTDKESEYLTEVLYSMEREDKIKPNAPEEEPAPTKPTVQPASSASLITSSVLCLIITSLLIYSI